MKKASLLLYGLFLTGWLCAQAEIVYLSNPSFEDQPGPGHPPLGWYFCGPVDETPPDVQPVPAMQVMLPAHHGLSFAGLVVRDNGTQETLGQQLSSPLQADQCYLFRIYAGQSAHFVSISRSTYEPAEFTRPVRLQVWAGDQHCAFQQLLAETPIVADTLWRAYDLTFRADADYDQLFLTAAADPRQETPYNGHIMLDKASPLIPIACGSDVASVALPEWEYPPATSDVAFLDFIKNQIRQIRWVRNGFSLEQEPLPSAASTTPWVLGNRPIFTIARSLISRPDALLTVAVGPKKGPLVQHHMRLLAAELLAGGLPPERCLIRPIRNKDLRRQDWLSKDGEIFWGISLGNK